MAVLSFLKSSTYDVQQSKFILILYSRHIQMHSDINFLETTLPINKEMQQQYKEQETAVSSALSYTQTLSITVFPNISITPRHNGSLFHKLGKDHQDHLRRCHKRFQNFILKTFSHADFMLNDFQDLCDQKAQQGYQLTQKYIERGQKNNISDKRMFYKRAKEVYCLDFQSEVRYYSWVIEAPEREESMYRQFKSKKYERVRVVGTADYPSLTDTANILISVILNDIPSIQDADAPTLCRVFRIAGAAMSPAAMRQLLENYNYQVFFKHPNCQ